MPNKTTVRIKPIKYKPIPIKAAREIAKAYGKDQVIVISWDKSHATMHVTTYGKTVEDCKQAARGGNKMKKFLGFPDGVCHDAPAREKAAVRLLVARARNMVDMVRGGYPSAHLLGLFEEIVPKLAEALETEATR